MGYGLGKETAASKAGLRSVLLASADTHFRGRLREQLTAMRWQVREASGGAEAIAQLEMEGAEALVLDSVLPDLEVSEFASQMRLRHPVMDLLRVDAGADDAGARSPRRNELLHALRQALEETEASPREMGGSQWGGAPRMPRLVASQGRIAPRDERAQTATEIPEMLCFPGQLADGMKAAGAEGEAEFLYESASESGTAAGYELTYVSDGGTALLADAPRTMPLPEMVGESAGMLELAHMVRLVAPRSTSVLIQGDTGTGKELVAKAVHRLSRRASKAFVVLNCAAIPESLLEAELFGHTRGAFTGAVQSRAGRIEAANGGTLFLDEIGEMPLALQAKMLRFLESGELQRVGDNDIVRVDVRVVAASHQPLQQRAGERTFRLDLYHRLAVFPVYVPPLRDRMQDVLPLAAYLLERLGEEMPVKRLAQGAAAKLMEHTWPGNVRELAHVLERGAILAEDRRLIGPEEIRF